MDIKLLSVTVISIIFIISCQSGKQTEVIDKYKIEILQTEKAFAQLVKEKGLKIAFTTYAAENAVLKRGNDLIYGKKAIEEYYQNFKYPDAQILWEPDYIDVSDSGDLAYTYGYFRFEAKDESGEIINDSGVFHTVWKRQTNGMWRYVWD